MIHKLYRNVCWLLPLLPVPFCLHACQLLAWPDLRCPVLDHPELGSFCIKMAESIELRSLRGRALWRIFDWLRFALLDDRSARTACCTVIPGVEPGGAANRQAFPCLPICLFRNVSTIRRSGRLVSACQRTGAARRRYATATREPLLTPNCQRPSALSRHTEVTTRLPGVFRHASRTAVPGWQPRRSSDHLLALAAQWPGV